MSADVEEFRSGSQKYYSVLNSISVTLYKRKFCACSRFSTLAAVYLALVG